MIIETENFYIVALDILDIRNFITGNEFELFNSVISKKNLKKYIKKAYENKIKIIEKYKNLKYIATVWFCFFKEKPIVMGEITINGLPYNGEIEIEYLVFYKYRNKGYMTEILKGYISWMFNQKFYTVNCISAIIEKSNDASRRVLTKVDMNNVKSKYNLEVWKINKNDKI